MLPKVRLSAAVEAAVTRPLASTVTLPYVPAATPVLDRVEVIDTFADPSNDTEPVTSDVREIVRAVCNEVAVPAFPVIVEIVTVPVKPLTEDTPPAGDKSSCQSVRRAAFVPLRIKDLLKSVRIATSPV